MTERRLFATALAVFVFGLINGPIWPPITAAITILAVSS